MPKIVAPHENRERRKISSTAKRTLLNISPLKIGTAKIAISGMLIKSGSLDLIFCKESEYVLRITMQAPEPDYKKPVSHMLPRKRSSES